MAPSGKDFAGARPTTAGVTSAFGQSDAQTAATLGGMGSAQADSQAALQIARNLSASRFSRFEENEKRVEKQPFKVFFTSNEPTTYHRENRFEGKSNYQFYYPTGETFEQELEQFWFEAKNKELMDKRRDEEHKQTMKEWGQARGRMEAEIARKKEHLNAATNFAAARGWTRTCWKSKNHRPAVETQEEFLQASSSDEDETGRVDLASELAESPVRFGRSEGLGTKSATLRASAQAAPPKVVDFAKGDDEYGYRLSTEDMVR